MGYDIYITRGEFWFDNEGPTISEEEWSRIIAEDSEFIAARTDKHAVYLYYPECRGLPECATEVTCDYISFCHGRGKLSAKKPNRATLIKMAHIAKLLGARVIGERDEIYDENGLPDRPVDYTPLPIGPCLRITRREHWRSTRGAAIHHEEWDAIVAADSELIRIDDRRFSLSDPTGPAWPPLFILCCCGNILVDDPSRAELLKMVQIAKLLNARVVGDEGEVYNEEGVPDRPTSYVIGE